jgi:hypothetical protein
MVLFRPPSSTKNSPSASPMTGTLMRAVGDWAGPPRPLCVTQSSRGNPGEPLHFLRHHRRAASRTASRRACPAILLHDF